MKRTPWIAFLAIFLLLVPVAVFAAEGEASGFAWWWQNIIQPVLFLIVLPALFAWLIRKFLDTAEKRQAALKIAKLADDFVGWLLLNNPDAKWLDVVDDVIDEFIEQLEKDKLANGNADKVAERALGAAWTRATGPGEGGVPKLKEVAGRLKKTSKKKS